MARRLKVGAAHVAPVFMNAVESAEKAATWIRKAGADGVSLLVFPEVFLPGFPYWINCYPPIAQARLNRDYQDQSVEAEGPELAVIQEAAREAAVSVIMGASERRRGGRTCYNSSFFISDEGAMLGVHRKLQPTYAERYIWGQGDGSTLVVRQMEGVRVGALACWENTMNLARQALIEEQEEVHAALWPALSTLAGFEGIANSQIEAMMKNHALTGQCFVIAASSPVTAEMIGFMESHLGSQQLLTCGGGWTAIVHPFTSLLAGPVSGEAESLVTATIDLDDLKDAKMWLDTTGHYARPEVLQLVVDRRPRSTVRYEEI